MRVKNPVQHGLVEHRIRPLPEDTICALVQFQKLARP
jgi:hypothetical protein